MTTKRKQVRAKKSTLGLRTSVSFPPDLYHTIEQLAKQKKVSIAWVVRDAAEKYVAEQTPPLKKRFE